MKSYSQAGQDLFAYSIAGKDKYYIDFGCNDPFFHNNTAALQEMGWTGLLVDIDPSMIRRCKKARPVNTFSACDLLKTDLTTLFRSCNVPKSIGYVSFDADAANGFLIENFPFNEYKVECLTFEHDLYRLGPELKNLSMKILKARGFELFKENVVAEGYGEFEDWWILRHPNNYHGKSDR